MAAQATILETPAVSDVAFIANLARRCVFAAALLLMFVLPIEGAVQIQGIGRLSRIVGLLAAAVWSVSIILTGRIRRPHLFHYFLGLFVVWNALSIFWTVDFDLTFDRMKTFFQLGVMVALFWDVFDTREGVRAGLQAFVLGAFASTVGIIYNFASSASYYSGRFTSGGLHVDDIGIILAITIPVAWYLATSGKPVSGVKSLLRLANFLYPALAIAGILLSGTRAALVASVPAFVFMLMSVPRLSVSMRIISAVALMVAAITLVVVIPSDSIDRFSTIGTEIMEGDMNGRVTIWREGLVVFTDAPILGVGAYAFRIATGSGIAAHNSLLSILVELGLVGFILFMGCLLLSLRSAIKLPAWEAYFCLAWIAVWLLGVSTLTWEHRKPTWVVLGYVVSMAASYACQTKSKEVVRAETSSA